MKMNSLPKNVPHLLLPIVVAAALLSCTFASRLVSQATPSPALPPTVSFPTLPPGEALLPTPSGATAVNFPRVQIGYYATLYLSYDPAVWFPGPKLNADDLPIRNSQGDTVEVLSHTQFQCELHDNLGHGMSQQYRLSIYKKQIGEGLYRVEQWVDTLSGNTILVVYQYPAAGDPNHVRRIELTAEDGNGKRCMQAVEEVLLLSAAEIRGNLPAN